MSPRLATSSPKYSVIEVHIDNHYRQKVYTSGDAITGHVRIVTSRNLRFGACEIILLGRARARIDTLNVPVTSCHTFLRLAMPIPELSYPVPRCFEAGREYAVPFHFVVPDHLTLGACSHHADSDVVRDHHVHMPPTMGSDAGLVNDGAAWERSDMAPHMASVEYVIRARVHHDATDADAAAVWSSRRGSTSSSATATTSSSHKSATAADKPLLEAERALRVLPATAAPVALLPDPDDRSYVLTRSKSLRKGLLVPLLRTAGSKLGCIRASVVDEYTTAASSPASSPGYSLGALPPPVVLGPDGHTATPTAACLGLRFDPVTADVPPPRITAVAAKLTAHTFFSIAPITGIPNEASWSHIENVSQRMGYYSTSLSLPVRCDLASLEWAPHVTTLRRDSGYCSDSPPEATDKTGSGVAIAYTAQLAVPLQLPLDRRTFLPTFHSCILSRTYSVQLSVTFAPGSTTSSSAGRRSKNRGGDSSSAGTPTTLTLTLPLHIMVAHSEDPDSLDHGSLPTFDAVMEEAEADAHLLPRRLAVPDAQFQETSTLPSYSSYYP